jgi:hypothetical protein
MKEELSNKEESNFVIHRLMDRTGEHYVKLVSSDSQKLHVLPHMQIICGNIWTQVTLRGGCAQE